MAISSNTTMMTLNMSEDTTVSLLNSSTFTPETDVHDGSGSSFLSEFHAIIRLTLTFNNILLAVRIIGILLNIVALRVLVSKKMKSSASAYLIMLVIFDILFLLSFSITNVLVDLDICLVKPSYWWTEVALIGAMGIGACGSILTTVTVTIERYVAIAHPFKIKILCSTKAKTFILCFEFCITIVIIGLDVYQSIAFYLPLDPTFGVKEALNVANLTNSAFGYYPELFMTCVYQRSNMVSKAEGFPLIQNIILYVIPTLILFVLNILIVRALYTASPIKSTRNQDDEVAKRRLLKSVMAISTMSMIAYPVSFFSACINVYAPDQYIPFDVMLFIEDLVHAINSSINCVFYCLIGNRFRSVLLHIVRDCCCPRRQQQEAQAPGVNQTHTRSHGTSSTAVGFPSD